MPPLKKSHIDGLKAVKAKFIITCQDEPMANKECPILIDHTLLYSESGMITKVVSESEFQTLYSNVDRVVRPGNQLIIPTFVNAHTHLGMTHLRGHFEGMELMDWLMNAVWPTEGHFESEDFIRLNMKAGIHNSLLNGVTCFNDMYSLVDLSLDLARETGVRYLGAHVLLDAGDNAAAKVRAQEASDRLRAGKNAKGRVREAASIHGAYTSKKEEQKVIIDAANASKSVLHTHLHETIGEMEMFKAAEGCSAVERFHELGALNERFVAAHCVHLTDDEVTLMGQHKVNAVHNPRSNCKLGSGICNIRRMMDAGINVALGTDSACSNNALSIMEEMRMAAFLSKTQSGPIAISDYEILLMATRNGAKALQMGDEIGQLKPGFDADFQIIDLDWHQSVAGVANPLEVLLYCNHASIRDVYIQGRPVVKDGNVMRFTLDKPAHHEAYEKIEAFKKTLPRFKKESA